MQPVKIVGPLRRVLSGLRSPEPFYLLWITLLHAIESLGVVATVYIFAFDSRTIALVVTVVIAVLFATRRALAAFLTRRVRLRLIEETVGAVLATEISRTTLLRTQDATLAIFEGTHFAERIVVEYIPGLAAAILASLVLGMAIACTAPFIVLLMATLALIVGATVMFGSRLILARHSASAAVASSRVSGGVVAAVHARVDLVANGRDVAFLDGLRTDARRWCDLAMRADRVSALAGRAPILAAALAVGALVGVDSSLRGEVLATGLARSAMYASAVPPFLALARWAMLLVKDAEKIRPLIRILDAERLPTGPAEAAPLPRLPSDVAWRGLSFHYGADADSVLALNDVSVAWPSGKSLLVVGPNGSGKSTLLRLLLGLYAPSSGSVTIDGTDVLSLDLHAWRACASYLGQRPYMLDRATVRETIALMAPRADDNAMRAALERLTVWAELARKSPADPLSTTIGALSVGQRQRVVVARVLAQNARLVVLDEPDANLDAAGVKIVAELVKELARDRMVIVAAHTPELAAAGDMVIELDRGRVRHASVDHTPHESGNTEGQHS